MKILYLNLDSDTHSRDLTEAELARVGIIAERVSAITGDNRPLAFNQSVYKAMEMCAELEEIDMHDYEGYGPEDDHLIPEPEIKYEDLLLFEDDVVFDANVHLAKGFNGYRLPDDFMSFHLGCNLIGMDTTIWQMPTPHSEHLAKLWNCWQSHATLYSAECVKFILDNFKYVTDEYKTEGCQIFDEWLRVNVLPMGRSYVMKPMIAYQRPRKSEIWNCHADYTSVHRRGNEYLNSL